MNTDQLLFPRHREEGERAPSPQSGVIAEGERVRRMIS